MNLKENKRYGNVVKVSQAIELLFNEEIFNEKNYQAAFIVFRWKKMNSNIINRNIEKVYVSRSYLYVQVKYSVLRHELYMLKNNYLTRINANSKNYKIKDIIFK